MPYGALAAKNITLHFVLVYVISEAARQAAINDITTYLEGSILRHPTLRRFGLEDIVMAHEGVESGQLIGKALLTLA